MARTYKIYISGNISDRHFDWITQDLIPFLTSDVHPDLANTTITNTQRGCNFAEITVNLPDKPEDIEQTEEYWSNSIIATIKGEISEQAVQSEYIP